MDSHNYDLLFLLSFVCITFVLFGSSRVKGFIKQIREGSNYLGKSTKQKRDDKMAPQKGFLFQRFNAPDFLGINWTKIDRLVTPL